jgi:uncharacterized iron-regulated membrane protein
MTMSSSARGSQKVDHAFFERERDRFAGRALSVLVLLNGVAAIVLLTILAQAPRGTVDSKIASAMLFFAGGAIAALLSSFLAYINRTVRIEAPERVPLRRALRTGAIVAVIGAGVAFLTGMNMVSGAVSEKSSSHPKGEKQKREPVSGPSSSPSERVMLRDEAPAIEARAGLPDRGAA